MRATSRQHPHGPLAARCVPAVLAYLMLVLPSAGQISSDQQPASQHSTSSQAKTTSGKSGASGSAKAKPGTSHASTSTTHSAKATSSSSKSKRRKPASRGRRSTRAERMARTAHMRKTFVASTELRPMAQQLAMMRTPEAYAGVTAFARKHTGEAAAEAYLALGHA